MATLIDTSVAIDFASIAHELKLPTDQVQRTVDLLDNGNTVPFITRYRKDQTGGLDEEQIRIVQQQVTRLRLLAERKATILKSIESQGKLTSELAAQIKAAPSTKRLEDLYLPFKPKKQSLATLARQRGLEPLADEIYEGQVASDELAERATHFVRVDKQLNNIDEVIQGVRHLLAERFSERPDLRGKLRKMLWQQGKIVSVRIGGTTKDAEPDAQQPKPKSDTSKKASSTAGENSASAGATPAVTDSTEGQAVEDTPTSTSVTVPPTDDQPTQQAAEQRSAPPSPAEVVDEAASNDSSEVDESLPATELASVEAADAGEEANAGEEKSGGDEVPSAAEQPTAEQPTAEQPTAEQPTAEHPTAEHPTAEQPTAEQPTAEQPVAEQPTAEKVLKAGETKSPAKPAVQKRAKKKKNNKKDKKREQQEKAFKDYSDFSEAVSRIPPHRVLAINRGEKARILRVKLQLDSELVEKEAAELVLPAEHPHAEFLKQCLHDALSRLVLPSLEREIRRELTEKAETHAVEVFAKNLRSLLLQPPVRGCRPLALDPGYRNGCKFSALDGFGNVLSKGVAYIVGKPERIQQGRKKILETIKEHNLNVIAIGNGTACRETEQLVAEMLADELKDDDISYVVVNEAGASVYSTSPLGREELPQYDAVLRGAISIGRRLLDPLSELVKINPANIGVGMYQHDVKAKHLQESLDAVVESCVNFVGVDVNTASPALLRYVSGLNQLTARRLFEHRQQHGPFKNREQLKEVAGFGSATFVQSAGFLKINDGDNPLDATWIHPESYEVTGKLLDKLGSSVSDLAPRPAQKPAAPVTSKAADAVETAAPAEPEQVQPANDPSLAQPEVSAPPTDDASAATASLPSLEVPKDPSLTQSEEKAPLSHETSEDASSPPAVEVQNGLARKESQKRLAESVEQLNVSATGADLGIGEMLLKDILSDLQRPGRDPREDLPKPIFRRGILKLEDLSPGMELAGTVLNVVDFGAFVDIGLHDTGLVHISRLANHYINDPHEIVSVGDVVTVWVHGIDKDRRRVSLTAIKPGTEKPHSASGGRPTGQSKDSRPPRRRDKAVAGKRKPGGGRPDKRSRAAKPTASYQKKKKPKPVTPITDAMADGREPMRAFSDLAQFFQKKDEPEEKQDGETDAKK